MLIGIAVAAVGAIVASWLMWWATRRNALWAMAAGVVATLVIFAAAVLIAWAIARATYGP